METNKIILVTGANGYIGNGTARAFIRAGQLTVRTCSFVTFQHGLVSGRNNASH